MVRGPKVEKNGAVVKRGSAMTMRTTSTKWRGDHEASLPDFDIALYKPAPAARLTLETARRIAAEISDWRKRGLQPKEFIHSEILRQAAEVDARAQVAAAQSAHATSDGLTVQDMFDAWTTDGARRKDVTEHDLRAVLRAMVERGVNRPAVMQRNNLTQMFAWARKRQPWRKLLVDGDPMELIEIEIEKIVSPDYDIDDYKDRVLSHDEIRELHATIASMHTEQEEAPNKRIERQPLAASTERAIWIMLSTLCRVGETSMARWEHVDLAAGTWFIPKENVKDNIADLTVYLSAFALDQFQQLRAHTGHSAWCFPARNNDGSIEGKSISKQVGDRQSMFKKNKVGTPRAPLKNRRSDNTLVLAGGKNGAWTPHDLRRTGATMMQALGISLDIIDRCQNHVLSGSKVRRSYMHHHYADEKRAAWEALEAIRAGQPLSQ